jgi:hypothetical protein
MSPQQKKAEIAFNRRYSRFKLQVFFRSRAPITHYGCERINCSVAQINFGHIKKFTIHRDFGLQDCINRIKVVEKLYGAYTTAIIYDNKLKTTMPDGSMQKGREIMKYVNGVKVEFTDWNKIFAISPEKILVEAVQENGIINIFPFKTEDTNDLSLKKNLTKDLSDLTKILSKKK